MSMFSTDIRVANTAAPSFQSQANVSQYGWTGADQGHYNQLIQYVDECRKIWLGLEEKIDYVETLLLQVEDIDQQVKYVEQMTAQVVKLANETSAYRNQVEVMYTELIPLFEDFIPKYEEVVLKHSDVVKMHDETEQAAIAAALSESEAAKSAKEAADIAEELRKGQVYRGTWNIEKNAAYPPKPDTNSVWDIVLNESSIEFVFDGITWYWGDRLLFLKDDDSYTQIEAGGSVTSVNGKKGAVTLTREDLVAAPDGYGLGGYGRSLANMSCNEATATGWYSIFTSTTDGPQGDGPSGSALEVIRWSSSTTVTVVHQTFHSYTTDRTFKRRMYNGVWQPWVELYSTAKKPTPSEIGAVTAAGFTLEGPVKVGNGPQNIQNLMGDNMIRSGGAGSHATVVGNTSGRTYIDSPDDILLLRAAGVERRVYTTGYKPSLTDLGALGSKGTQTLEGSLLVNPGTNADPISLTHSFNAAGANAQGIAGYNSKDSTKRAWGVGAFANNANVEYTYLGVGESPWATGIRIKPTAIEAYQPLYVAGSVNATVPNGGEAFVLNYNKGNDGGVIRAKEGGDLDWYVGRTNTAGDVALYSNKQASGVILRKGEVEFAGAPRVGGAGTIFYSKPLSTIDLNTLSGIVNHSMYYQDTSANATTARNYPIAEAGSLIVMGGAYGAQQEYTSYNANRKFVRGKINSTTWLPWTEIGGPKHYYSGYNMRCSVTPIPASGTGIVYPASRSTAYGIGFSNNEFVIAKTGAYKIDWGFSIESQAGNQQGIGEIFKNGAVLIPALIYNYCPPNTALQMGISSASVIVDLVAGDKISLRVRTANSTTVRLYQSGSITIQEM